MDKNRIRKNLKPYRKLYRNASNIFMFLVFVLIFTYFWYAKLNAIIHSFEQKGNWLMIFLYAVVLYMSLRAWGGFSITRQKLVNVISSQVLACFTAAFIGYALIILASGTIWLMSEILIVMLQLFAVQLVMCILCPLVLVRVYMKLFPAYRMLMINGDHKNRMSEKVNGRKDKYQICEAISVHEPMEVITDKILQYDAVLLNDIPTASKNLIIKFCYDNSVRLYFTPKIPDIVVQGSDRITFFDSPIFLTRNNGMTIEQRFFKRFWDIVISLAALIITSPILLITAIAIKLEDGGHIFYVQERCTRGDKTFMIYKFRSMKETKPGEDNLLPTLDDDDRVTRVGKVIRPFRIDELPQLINILKGEMSVVGPRPERTELIRKYCEDIPEFSFRTKVKAGLTGYAQVYGKYNTSAYDKLKMDLIYIVNYSVQLDLQILLETVKILFKKESTEGFTQEQIEEFKDLDL